MLLLDVSGNSSKFRQIGQVSPPVFPSRIAQTFSNSSNYNPLRTTPNFNVGVTDLDLETFYCDSCVPKTIFPKWIQLLSNVFPKLRKFVLKLDENVPITTSTFEHFLNLEFVVVMDVRGSVNLLNKRKGTWYMKSLKYSSGFSHLEFVLNRKENFWSSEAEYFVGSRLWSYEKVGFKTGHYKYSGGYETRRRISVIPEQIQNRLHTVEILNTAMSKQVFFDSFTSAKQLKVLRLINVSFTDYFVGDLHFPNLIEYRFDVQLIPQLNYLSFRRLIAVADILYRTHFLFEEVQPGFDVKVNLLSSRVKKYHISYATCVLLHWDANEGTLISGISHTSEWLRNVKENPVRKLSFRYWELDPTSLPSTISHLNLNFVIVKNIGVIFQRLSSLVNLKLINVRVNDDGNFKDWDWIQIDLAHVSKHSHTLEYLALEKSHVRNYSPGMTFEKVEFVYLESCTFEKSFVRNFMSIFPNVKRLVILGGNDPSIQIYVDVIILSGLRSKTLEWILMSNPVSGSSPNRPRKEINSILHRIGINQQDSKYLILERSPNSEGWSRNSNVSESMVESELLEMKGVSDIGTYSQCHANTHKQGGWRGFVQDIFGGLIDITKLGTNTRHSFNF